MFTNKNPPPDYAPIGCVGAFLFCGGIIFFFVALSGDVKKDVVGVWVLAFLLLLLGAGGLTGAWKMRKASRATQRAAKPSAPSPEPPVVPDALAPGEVRCPRCGHVFVPPRIMLVTDAVARQYGKNPAQCPQCRHIWGR
jgi:hypothetical protein